MTSNKASNKVFLSVGSVALLAASLFPSGCRSAYRSYQVVGDSMIPLLKPGDRIFVDESAHARSDIHDGEVIAFRRENTVILMRLIAMPGETISGADRKVFLNGKQLDEPYLAPATSNELAALTTFAPRIVATDELFVMGDNRDFSFDSREPEYGSVKLADVVGQYRVAYWHAPSHDKPRP